MSSQSDDASDPALLFSDTTPPEFDPIEAGFAQEGGDYLPSESLGDILQFDDDDRETSGLLNDSELLNRRDGYDSGSYCPSEDHFAYDGDEDDYQGRDRSRDGTSSAFLQRYMEATPRAVGANCVSEGRNGEEEESDRYSDDVFDHAEQFYHNNNNNDAEHRSWKGASPRQNDQLRKGTYQVSTEELEVGIERETSEGGGSTSRSELNNTKIAVGESAARREGSDVVNYGDSPPDGRNSDLASMTIGQFVPNAVTRNRVPRPAGKPTKRSTPKSEAETPITPRSSVGTNKSVRSSTRDSQRPSTSGSYKSRSSHQYSSIDPSHHSEAPFSTGRIGANSSNGRPKGVPRLSLQRDSLASSPNLSLSSDLSKVDLSVRLHSESRARRQADEVANQLQKNYDDLLGKYALAENTIDKLKLGARVNLYSDGPSPGQSLQGTFSPAQKQGLINFQQPQNATIQQNNTSSSHVSPGQTRGQPPKQSAHSTTSMQTNKNIPTGTSPQETTGRDGFPVGEGVTMALTFQAQSLREQIDSFSMLLQEDHIAPTEQKTLLARLRADQSKLEADYMHAKEEHSALKRRNSLLGGGGGDGAVFDPERALEGEIFQLGMKMEDVAEIVQNNLCNNPPTITPLPTQQQQQPQGSPFHQPQPVSSNDEKQGELQRHALSRQQPDTRKSEQDEADRSNGIGEDNYGANPVSASDESEEDANYHQVYSPPQASHLSRSKGAESGLRNKQSHQAQNGSRQIKQSQLLRPTSLSKDSYKNAGRRGPSSDTAAEGEGRDAPPVQGQKHPENAGFLSPEADSGFMGSESSRQSNQNSGLGYDRQSQLRKPRQSSISRQTQRSSKLLPGHRSPPQIHRRLPEDWESPGFSDYDISERDEEVEGSVQSTGTVVKRKPGSMDRVPTVKNTSQASRRSHEKVNPRERFLQSDSHKSSGIRYATEANPPVRQHLPDQSHRPSRTNTNKMARTGYRDSPGILPPPEAISKDRSSRSASRTKHDGGVSLRPIVQPKGEREHEQPRQRLVSPRRGYDSMSEATRGSVKSEVVRELQGDIERLKQQMAKMGSVGKKKTLSPSVVRESHRPKPSYRKPDSVVSDTGSGRSGILRALQDEIDDLRNQVNEQDSPPTRSAVREDSPLTRTSLGEPQRESRLNFSSPLPRERLRESLRQEYIPQGLRSYPRTQIFQPAGSGYQSPHRNPVFESTPVILRPRYESRMPSHELGMSSYEPRMSTYPVSSPNHYPSEYSSPGYPSPGYPSPGHPSPGHPSPGHPSPGHPSPGHPSPGYPSSGQGVPHPSPAYTPKVEPCPTCSGTGVHTHGDYSYPVDYISRPPQNNPDLNEPVYNQNSQTHNPTQLNNHGGQSTANPEALHHQQSFVNPQPVFHPQAVLNQTQPLQNSSQPVVNSQLGYNQPQQSFTQPQSVSNQPPLVSNQPPLNSNQPQPVPNQPQPVPNQQLFSNNPQTVSNRPQQQGQLFLNQPQTVSNQPQPVLYQPQPVPSQSQPVPSQSQPVSSQSQPVPNQPQGVSNQPQAAFNQPQPVLFQPQLVPNQTSVVQIPNHSSTPSPYLQAVYTTPVVNIPMVALPVYAGVPVETASVGTAERSSKTTDGDRKSKKTSTSHKSSRETSMPGGNTTIYITPTKRRGRYYVLDDQEEDTRQMQEEDTRQMQEEEYYFRRTPHRSGSKITTSLGRKSRDSKPGVDLDKAIRLADKLNRSSHRMLATVRNDLRESDLLS